MLHEYLRAFVEYLLVTVAGATLGRLHQTIERQIYFQERVAYVIDHSLAQLSPQIARHFGHVIGGYLDLLRTGGVLATLIAYVGVQEVLQRLPQHITVVDDAVATHGPRRL